MKPLPHDLWMIGHTTDDISDLRFTQALADQLRMLFDISDMRVLWVQGTEDEPRSSRYAALNIEQLASIYARGGIAFEGMNGEFFAGITWRRIEPDDEASFINNEGHVQNSVSLDVDSSLLRDPAFRNRYVETCISLSAAFNTNYLYAYHGWKSNARFGTRLNLGVCLKDIYWINVFGAPYLRIIAPTMLLACPAYEARLLPGDKILVRATEEFLEPGNPIFEEARMAIRTQIGDRFFTKHVATVKDPFAGEKNVIGWWRFVRLMMQVKRQAAVEPELADVRPTFDWQAILVSRR